MDPLVAFKWLGACAEPSIEEAQPAWWLDLQRAEALNAQVATRQVASKDDEVERHYTLQQAFDVKTVRCAPKTTVAEPRCYENDAEFVISGTPHNPADRHTARLLKSEKNASWDLSELDDLERMRHALLPPIIETPSHSMAEFSSSDSNFADSQRHSVPSDEESVFHGLHRKSCDAELAGSPFF
ncbi:hypothetical protein Esti_002329 [Eimeria stiedai]